MCVCVCLVAQWCPTLCNPLDCSLRGSSIHGILQARILEWVAMPFSRGSSQPRDRIVSAVSVGLQVDSLPIAAAKLLQWCPTLCDPMDCSPPDSSVHGILQARILKWVAMPSSRGSSQARIEPRSPGFDKGGKGGFFTIWATREAQEYWSG